MCVMYSSNARRSHVDTDSLLWWVFFAVLFGAVLFAIRPTPSMATSASMAVEQPLAPENQAQADLDVGNTPSQDEVALIDS